MTCKAPTTREACGDIAVDGHIWRYSLTRPTAPTTDTVIVDFGGPGLAVLGGEVGIDGFVSAFPRLRDRYNILVVEEPWVTAEVPAACDFALSAFYQAVRTAATAIQARADALSQSCGLLRTDFRWGFTPRSYSRLVDAIVSRESLAVRGFVGFSWGSVRLAYLDRPKLDFTVLVRPFPVGVSADTLVEARARVNRSLGRELAWRPPSTTVPGRSVPVTDVDLLSAEIALGYLEQNDLTKAWAGLSEQQDPVLVGHLSDTLWGRYGRGSVAPSVLARLQETCAVVGPVGAQVVRNDSVADILSASFAPCGGANRHRFTPIVSGKGCVVSAPADTVTPDNLVRRSYRGARNVRWETSHDSSHRSLDGVARCLDAVLR